MAGLVQVIHDGCGTPTRKSAESCPEATPEWGRLKKKSETSTRFLGVVVSDHILREPSAIKLGSRGQPEEQVNRCLRVPV